MKNFLTRQSHSITGAAILLGLASFLSRIIGLLRDRVFVHLFGAGDIVDAYLAAFRIPDFLFQLLLAGALTAGFVPIFLELWHKDPSKSWALTNRVLRMIALIMGGAGLLGFIAAPYLVPLVTPGFEGEKLRLTIQLTRIMMLSPLLMGLSGVLSGVLHARRQFTAFAFAPLIYNLTIIVSAVFLVPRVGPQGLAWGVVTGALLHCGVQLSAVIGSGWNMKSALGWRDRDFKRMITLIIPRTFSLATGHLSFVILDSMASTLASGSITIFYLAYNLHYIPVGLVGQAFALAAFPVFAASAAEKNYTELAKQVARVIRQILFLVIPSMIIMVILRAQMVRVAYGTGKFNWENTGLTADVLGILILSLAAQCIMLVVIRALYALQDTWITFWVSSLGVLLTIFVGYFGKTHFGLIGLAGSLSLCLIIQCAVLWMVLRHKLGSLYESSILTALAKISLASAAMALVAQTVKAPVASVVDMTRLWGILSQGLISGTLGVLVYLGVCSALGLEEITLFWESFQKRWLKVKVMPEKIEG